MSWTWTRQTRTYELDGNSVNNASESPLGPSELFAYTTDHLFKATKSFDIIVPADGPETPGQSSLTFRTETTNINSSGAKVGTTSFSEARYTWFKEEGVIVRELREARDGICQYDPETGESTELWADEWETYVYAGGEEHDYSIGPGDGEKPTTEPGLNQAFYIIAKDPVEGLGRTFASPGSYRSEHLLLENGSLVGSPELIGNYDVREMRIRQLRNKCAVDPEEETPKAYAEVYVYPTPGQSPLFGSWTPSGPLGRKIEIEDASNSIVYSDTGTEAVDHSPPTSSGLVATLEIPFEGKDNNGKFLKEDVEIDLTILGDGPGPGNTRAVSRGPGTLFHRKCPCEEHQNEVSISVVISLAGAGPLAVLVLLYKSLDKCKPPGSMGYGWSTLGSARIIEPESGVVVYRSENGMIKRWQDDGTGNYLPSREDNYTDLTVDTLSTNARYVLKFRDQSVREFDANRRLKTERDRNNNTLSYTYTGTQLDSVQDNRGHSVHFGYDGSPDGLQPTSIRASDPVNGRLTQLDYHPVSHRLMQVTDPASQITQFEYDSEGRLSKQTIVRPTLGNLVTEYFYTVAGRLYRELINQNLERSHSRENLRTTITTRPLIDGEPTDQRRNQYFEKDTDGRVLVHILNYEGIGDAT